MKFVTLALLLSLASMVIALRGHLLFPDAAFASGVAWPAHSNIKRTPGSVTLVVFAHPECSFSESTRKELKHLFPKIGNQIETHVVFRSAESGPLWNQAATLSDGDTHLDVGGREAALFGAKTPGQFFVYDGPGTLTFQGLLIPGQASPQARAQGCSVAKAKQ